MMVFVDTSAFYAILDRNDENHRTAAATLRSLLDDSMLVTTNYVLVETCALVQSRLGTDAVRVFHEKVSPLVTIEWVGKVQHESAMAAVLTAGRRKLSLVDCISFSAMREAGIKKAFAFDRHFTEQGFECRF